MGTADLGVYQIINVVSGKALTGSVADNHVSQITNWGLANGQWTFQTGTSPNQFFIVNRSTGQVLEIGGGATTPGSTTNLWDNYGHPWQQWLLFDAYDQYDQTPLTLAQAQASGRRCKIKSSYAGKVLEIGGSGSQLYQEDRAATLYYDYAYDDSQNQKQQWYVQFVSANRTGGPGPTTKTPGKAQAAAQRVELSPNPAHDVLSVSLPGANDLLSVRVTDARGAATPARYLGNGRVDVAGLAPGFYVVTVSDGRGEHRQKFVKE